MMLRLTSLLVASLALSACRSDRPNTATGDIPSPAHALLARSIAYHDPSNVWGRDPIELRWTSLSPNGDVGYVFDVVLEPNGDFHLNGSRADQRLEYHVEAGAVRALVDGSEDISDELRGRMGLRSEAGLFWRNYIGFLGSFPMCLQDPNVHVEPPVRETILDGQPVLAIDADFDPEVGSETYTFYFEAQSARLVGCRFYRRDPTSDGETIVFEGESTVSGLRLPRLRHWYTNAGSHFLGTDRVE